MDCDFNTRTIWIILTLAWFFGSHILKLLKKLNAQKSASSGPLVEIPKVEAATELIEEEEAVTDSAARDPLSMLRQEYEARGLVVKGRANELLIRIVHERYNQPFVDVMRVYVPKQLNEALAELKSPHEDNAQAGADRVIHVEQVLSLVEYMLEQRRHPGMRPMIGDADRLADDCYRPVLVWARSQGVGITSSHPAVVFGDFDLSIASGLIPTTVAPIFLPKDFFERITWWPGLTHEIGHDFYYSVPNFDSSSRADFGLPSSREGAQLIPVSQGGIALSDIHRAFGAWLEEIFCDVFGVMMSGPAYLATMIEVFADPDDSEAVLTTPLNGYQSGLGEHPPAHLRFLLVSKVLSEIGYKRDADLLMPQWLAANSLGEAPQHLYLATTSGFVRIPIEPLTRINEEIGLRMYRGPLSGLNGRGLSGISGLDYGPHRHNESGRARDALLAGQVPKARDTRAVMSGAVLAATQKPEAQLEILRLARLAIPALNSNEVRRSVYDLDASIGANAFASSMPVVADVVGGLILADIMRRPGHNRRQRG